jgi:hypothetical protein
VVVRVDTHDPSAVVTLLAKHVGDCDIEGLRGHACEYATRPMAKCLAATATDSALLRHCCRTGYAVPVVRLQDETRVYVYSVVSCSYLRCKGQYPLNMAAED